MGAGSNDLNIIPSRPLFYWDAKSPPCTDGKGNQEKYKSSVLDCKQYHDLLPEISSNKVFPAVQRIVLKSQLYEEAADLCSGSTNIKPRGGNGVDLIMDTFYQRDFFSAISETYGGFHKPLNTGEMKTNI